MIRMPCVLRHPTRVAIIVLRQCKMLDWRIPPQLKYSMIVGGDVLYERRNIDPVLNLCDQCLLPEGRCWFADGGRTPASEFCETARRQGWQLRILDELCQEQPAVQTAFQVFEISRASTTLA